MGSPGDNKKSILTKLFKGGQQKAGGPPGYAPSAVNSSFNDQLMNQTNFGYNPQRQTIVSTPNHGPEVAATIEPLVSGRGGERRELNTQKRNRNQTIGDGHTHRGGAGANTMHFQELYSNYQGTPGGSSVPPRGRVNSGGVGAGGSGKGQQLFLPGAIKMQVKGQRKAPVTQHQQHRSHSHGAGAGVSQLDNNNQVQINDNV